MVESALNSSVYSKHKCVRVLTKVYAFLIPHTILFRHQKKEDETHAFVNFLPVNSCLLLMLYRFSRNFPLPPINHKKLTTWSASFTSILQTQHIPSPSSRQVSQDFLEATLSSRQSIVIPSTSRDKCESSTFVYHHCRECRNIFILLRKQPSSYATGARDLVNCGLKESCGAVLCNVFCNEVVRFCNWGNRDEKKKCKCRNCWPENVFEINGTPVTY